jgi:hypothetical protein
MSGWVFVAADATRSNEGLEAWVDRAVNYVSALPPK